MDDVQRVFRKLVEVITESDPNRLRAPIEVAEIYQTIIPYRNFKTVLEFDSNQDYEMVILRLLAGEHGYAHIDPPEVQQALAKEAAEVNPNPGAFREYAAARVFLNTTAVEDLVVNAPPEEQAYAPPDQDETQRMEPPPSYAPTVEEPIPQPPEPEEDPTAAPTLPFTAVQDDIPPVQPPAPEPPAAPLDATGRPSVPGITTFSDEIVESCPSCTRVLPRRADLSFCPFCGMDVITPSCRFCGAELDGEWTFCISCGKRKDDTA